MEYKEFVSQNGSKHELAKELIDPIICVISLFGKQIKRNSLWYDVKNKCLIKRNTQDVNFSNGYFASKSVYKYRKIRTSEITLSFLNTKIASKYKVEDIMKQLNK